MKIFDVDDHAIISSEPREPGWQAFVKAMPNLMMSRKPTKQVLPKLHKLVTTGLTIPDPSQEILEEAAYNILLNMGLPLNQVIQEVRDAMQNGDFLRSAKKGKIGGITCNPSINLVGSLRSAGTGKKDKGLAKIAYFPAYVYLPRGPLGDFSYQAPTEGLEELYNKLCDKYDDLFKNNNNPVKKLQAIAFLQLWGTLVIHPFFDANGRTFLAQAVLAFNQMGHQTTKQPAFPELHEQLRKNIFGALGSSFLIEFLDQNNIKLEEVNTIALGGGNLHKETTYLKDAINKGLDMGINQPSGLQAYLEQAVLMMVGWLSKENLYEDDKEGYKYVTSLIEDAAAEFHQT